MASFVRTLGYAVNATFTDDTIGFGDSVNACACDVALITINASRTLNLPHPESRIKRPPLIALIEDGYEISAGELIDAGASDVAFADDKEHIRHCITQAVLRFELVEKLSRTENHVHELHQQLMVLLQTTTQAVAFVHEGFHVYANPAYLKALGYASLEKLQGMPLLDLLPDTKERESLAQAIKKVQTSRNGKIPGLPLALSTSDDQIAKYQVELTPSHFDGERVTQIILAKEVSNTLSTSLPVPKAPVRQITDPVTHVYSQAHMMTLLDTTVAHAQERHSEYMLYLIHLETGPDKPEYTDQCMRAAAQRLTSAIDSGDVLGRYSANSFVLLTLHDSSRDPKFVAEKLRHSVGNLGGLLHGKTWVRVSGVIIDKYCNDSDHALSRLKDVFVYSQDIKTPVEIDITQFIHTPGSQMMDNAWARRISTILQNNRLTLGSLPVVSLKEDAWERLALQLTLSDENGIQMPLSRFKETVVSTGLAVSVDRWIIFNAARKLTEQLQETPTTQYFIPLVGNIILQNDIHTWLDKVIQQFRLPANSIILPVDAEHALDNPISFSRFCQSMADLNCGICVTGHEDPTVTHELFNSSKNRIKYLAPDPYLVSSFDRDRDSYETLEIIAEQCHKEKTLTIVSEVIESGEISKLWKIGIDLVISPVLAGQEENKLELDLSATLSA